MVLANNRKLIITIAVTFSAGLIGSLFPPDPEWFEQLKKPLLYPPEWVFPVVWPILYLLMAIAAYLVWLGKTDKTTKIALGAYLVQIVMNASWTFFFFGLHMINLALWDVSLLWAAILVTIILFAQKNTLAALLLVPYFLWTGFAVYLNAAIWMINK